MAAISERGQHYHEGSGVRRGQNCRPERHGGRVSWFCRCSHQVGSSDQPCSAALLSCVLVAHVFTRRRDEFGRPLHTYLGKLSKMEKLEREEFMLGAAAQLIQVCTTHPSYCCPVHQPFLSATGSATLLIFCCRLGLSCIKAHSEHT